MMGAGGYYPVHDNTYPCYCGYCKKPVEAYLVELVIDSDPEPHHRVCPKCENTIGGSRLKDLSTYVSIGTAILVVVMAGISAVTASLDTGLQILAIGLLITAFFHVAFR